MKSLRIRLAIGGAAAVAVALFVATIGLALLFQRYAQRSLADELATYLRQIAGAVVVGTAGDVALDREPANPLFSAPLSGLYWQISDGEGPVLRSRSIWDQTLALSPSTPTGEVRWQRIEAEQGTPMLVAERAIIVRGPDGNLTFRVSVARSLDAVYQERNDFLIDLAPAIAALALVLTVAGYIQIGNGLKPLERLRQAVADIRAGHIQRLSETVPVEVLPVVEELNALLAAQAQDVQRARDRAADLAHALKTPLAALAGDAERLRQQGLHEVADEIRGLGESMQHIVEHELARFRTRGGAARARTPATELLPVANRIARTIGRTPDGQRVRIEIALSGAEKVPFDVEDTTEVLGNLLENAARHGRTLVRVAAANGGDLVVEDDGIGIAPDLRGRAIERGQRLDERGAGAGLGLAIVTDIVQAYGWTLTLETSPLGGLRALIRDMRGREGGPREGT